MQRELLAAGGATIATPRPPEDEEEAAAFPLAARTVVQADGDLLYLVTDAYRADAAVRALHAERVAAWFAELQRTLATLTVAVRRAGYAAGTVVVAGAGWQAVANSLLWGLGTMLVGTIPWVAARAGVRALLAGRLPFSG